MAIQLDPTEAEARQLIACLVGYWLLFAVALIGKSGLFLLLMLPAAVLLLFFFWIVLRIVARETGRPHAMYSTHFEPFGKVSTGGSSERTLRGSGN